MPLHSAEVILSGVLKLRWKDGHIAVVDLRPVIADGEMFEFLRKEPARFDRIALEPHGHKIYWLDDDGEEIDLRTMSLRKRAERQAAILRLAS